MKISVCMPIYNSNEEYLRASIESILNQSYKDFEFIILNDSPGNMQLDEIVLGYKDPRIVYVKNDVNRGVAYSRNKLNTLAKGEYVAVMDHDDISLPNRLQLELDYMEKNPRVGVVGGCARRIPSGKKFVVPSEDFDLRLSLFDDCPFIAPTVMFRKSVLIDNGIRSDENMDIGFWCKFAKATKFHNLQDILVDYRWHGGNMSNIEDFRFELTKTRYNYIQENPALYEAYLRTRTQIRRIKILGLLVIKIVSSATSCKWFLFGVIPVCNAQIKYKLKQQRC